MATIARTRAMMETTTAMTWRPVRNWGSFDVFRAPGVHRSLPTQASAYYAAGDDAGGGAYYYAAAGDDVRGPRGEIETFLRDTDLGSPRRPLPTTTTRPPMIARTATTTQRTHTALTTPTVTPSA